MNISVPLCDSHIHLFRDGYHDTYDARFARHDELSLYEALRATHHIEMALVVGYEGDPQFEGNNRDIANWAQECDWIAPLAYYDAENPPTFVPENREIDSIFRGISLYLTTPEKAHALKKWPRETIATLNRNRSILSINIPPEVLSHARSFFERLEDCSILISHLGMPGAFREPPSPDEVSRRLEPLQRMSEMKNIGVKASALYAVSDPSHDYPHRDAQPILHRLRADFGIERLFWGSDFSPALEYVSFAQTIDALAFLGWTQTEMNAVMGDNLRRILRSD